MALVGLRQYEPPGGTEYHKPWFDHGGRQQRRVPTFFRDLLREIRKIVVADLAKQRAAELAVGVDNAADDAP